VALQRLFSPVNVGPLTISHRVVMPPLTRMRSNADDSINDMMVNNNVLEDWSFGNGTLAAKAE
jgi:2,4-dienoyl-CoA reductase-like NADH-dependent reductase (Old Yellow Enzyme family)